MLPAARRNDFHICPAHSGGTICAPMDAHVETNDLPQARGTDPAICVGSMDFIVTGSGTVTVHSKPAARLSDKTMHGGAILVGSNNVFIGGPTVGVTLGNPDAARADCEALAATRHNAGSARQSYGNCGIEAWRAVINRDRAARGLPPLSEDEALQRAVDIGSTVSDTKKDPANSGGTNAPARVKLLSDQGVEAGTEPSTEENLQQRVAEGRGVSMTTHPYWYWPHSGVQPSAAHEVQVTGVEYDENGHVKAYIIADSGIGDCAFRLDASGPNSDFQFARSRGSLTVTKQPVR